VSLHSRRVEREDTAPANLVDRSFWDEEFLGKLELPARPDPDMAFERCLGEALAEHAPAAPGQTVLEIGCAPGRWLVYFAERFGARVEGIEYGERGARLTRANLASAGIDGDVHECDFFEAPVREADVVLSLGFIEHFDDLDAVFRRHLDFLAPGGRLAIGVPNFKGFNRLLQRWGDPAHLRLHNLRAMRPALYRELADRHGVEVEWQGHLGGFDPIIIKPGRPGSRLVTLVEGRWRRLRLADRVNHPWLSSYLLTVLRSRGAPS
jgi:SAM-dependent methyltransferase